MMHGRAPETQGKRSSVADKAGGGQGGRSRDGGGADTSLMMSRSKLFGPPPLKLSAMLVAPELRDRSRAYSCNPYG